MRGAGSRFAPKTTVLLLSLAVVLPACGNSAPLAQPNWPAPPDPMSLARKAGFEPTTREFLVTHTHAHLDVLVAGTPIPVTAGIGIGSNEKRAAGNAPGGG